jgi:hypothetical protein
VFHIYAVSGADLGQCSTNIPAVGPGGDAHAACSVFVRFPGFYGPPSSVIVNASP